MIALPLFDLGKSVEGPGGFGVETDGFFKGFGIYSGASLPAFVKLAEKKGYRLVGCQRYGFNAVFLRNDVGQREFPEVSARDCFNHPFAKWAFDELRPMVADKEWLEV